MNKEVLREYYFPFRNIRVSGDQRPFMISPLKFARKDVHLLMPALTFRVKNAQDRNVLGSHACTRCHGYIERKPVLIFSLFEWVVRCVNCGRLYRWLNSQFEKYPADKTEWDEGENKRAAIVKFR